MATVGAHSWGYLGSALGPRTMTEPWGKGGMKPIVIKTGYPHSLAGQELKTEFK